MATNEIRPRRPQTRDREVTVSAILAAAEIEFAINGFSLHALRALQSFALF